MADETQDRPEPPRPHVRSTRRTQVAPRRRSAARGPVGPFDLGPVISRTFSVWFRHLPYLLPLVAVFHVPLLFHELSLAEEAFDLSSSGASIDDGWDAGPAGFWDRYDEEQGRLSSLLGLVFALLLQATITYAVFRTLRGESPQYHRSVLEGLKRFHWAFLAAIFTLLLVGFAWLGIGMLGLLLGIGGLFLSILVGGVVALAMLCTYFVGVQAAVVERVGPFKAMARSAYLTSKFRWKVFAVVVLYYFIPTLAIVLVLREFAWSEPDTLSAAKGAVAVEFAVNAIWSSLTAVGAAVVYHDLRRSKEGVDVTALLRVFA